MDYENIELHTVDEDGFMRTRVIPVAALASWGELLGLTEPSEILSAIMYVQDHGEPPADAEGNSVWVESYKALTLRENVKLAVMKQAQLEGKANDPRSPKLRAALAALEVKPLIQAAQEDTRRQLLPPEMENVMPALPITPESLVPARQEFLDSLTIASP